MPVPNEVEGETEFFTYLGFYYGGGIPSTVPKRTDED